MYSLKFSTNTFWALIFLLGVTSRVSGGDPSVPPNLAVIEYKSRTSSDSDATVTVIACSGILVSKNEVLTWSGCALSVTPDDYPFYVIRLGLDRNGRGGTTHTISKVELHPKYDHSDPALSEYNVAIIHLKESVTCESCYPLPYGDDRLNGGESVKVSGVQDVNKRTIWNNQLRIYTQGVCRDKIINNNQYVNNRNSSLDNNQRCVGLRNGQSYERGLCHGYFGSPVLYREQLVGIVTKIDNNCDSDPTVMLRIGGLKEWIKQVTRNDIRCTQDELISAAKKEADLKSRISRLSDLLQSITKSCPMPKIPEPKKV